MKPLPRILLPILLAALAATLALSLRAGRRSGPPAAADDPGRAAAAAAARPSTAADLASPPPEAAREPAPDAPSDPGAAPAPRAAPAALPPSDPTLRAMRPQLRFAARVRALRELPPAEQAAEGRRLLASSVAEDRALGGTVLFLAGQLHGAAQDGVVADGSLSVPLTVFDWVRDFGSDEEIALFAEALDSRELSDEDLLAYIAGSAAQPGGGRSALDLLLPRHDEETVEDAILPVVSAAGASYDVREQALFKLLEPESKRSGMEALEELAAALPDGDASVFAQAVAKWTELGHLSDPDDEDVPYKVWDTPLRELSYLAGSDVGLAVRDMANYLEYGLRRDDADFEPVVEEGSWETAKAFLDRALAMRDSLSPEEDDALDRLAANLDRLKAYDPAFAPDDDGDDPYADEEIDVAILDAEDFYVAEYLADDEEDDEDEEDLDEDEDDDEDEEDLDEDEDDEDEEEEEVDEGEDEDEVDEDDEDGEDDSEDEEDDLDEDDEDEEDEDDEESLDDEDDEDDEDDDDASGDDDEPDPHSSRLSPPTSHLATSIRIDIAAAFC